MFSLKNHPFAVETTFEKSVVLTFAIPKEELQNLIPECLELHVFEDKYAFLAIALVATKNLRPKGSFVTIVTNKFRDNISSARQNARETMPKPTSLVALAMII